MLRNFRRLFASIFLLGITLLFLDFSGLLSHYLSWMAKAQFLPAVMSANLIVIVVLIVSTLILGRVYCSVICPLGIMQDVISHIGGRVKKNRFRFSKEKRILRLVVLGIFVVMIICGIGSAVALLAPYSAYGRIVTNIVQPAYIAINNLLADWAEANNSYAFYKVDLWLKSISALIVAIVTLLAIGFLAWKHGRTYCNTICPVGTVLGYVAKFSILKPIIDTSKCVNCGLCSKNCKASCINVKEHTIDYSRCVSCFNCLGKCNKHAISYQRISKTKVETINQEKRNFLSMLGIMATTAAASAQEKTVDGGLAPIVDKSIIKRDTPLVPAGSQSLRNFYQKCTGCQLCITKCPNGVLRPSSELTNLLQPVMSYERGFCRPECTECSQVCPAGAIRPITRVEKSSIKIGTAVWNKELCLPLTDGVECGNCSRKCPVGAIRMVPSDKDDEKSIAIPIVDSERCIGCGACENLCPVRPISAIHVEGIEVHRFN
ncbi:MAG: 4Fe-4S binding protein [Bacteroidales bacterium]|nr:4Fe-4S binding protein [Bacteroidales bacterium]